MRKRLEAMRDGWTTPNVFPWDELISIICELNQRVVKLEGHAKDSGKPGAKTRG